MLQRGDLVPHFEVRTVTGEVFSYSAIWQRRNLVLVALPPAGEDDRYAREMEARGRDFDGRESTCVITRDAVPGLAPPGALVADRWGEVVHVAAATEGTGLPPPQELLEWLDYLGSRCPECEGEAK